MDEEAAKDLRRKSIIEAEHLGLGDNYVKKLKKISTEFWSDLAMRVSQRHSYSTPIHDDEYEFGVAKLPDAGACEDVASASGSGTPPGLKPVGERHRGALIVFEGPARSGRTTQSKSLATFLRSLGESVEEWGFPDQTTEIGAMICSYLSGTVEYDDAAVHLLFSANRWEKRKLMEAALQAGVTIIVDRYSYSGVAFTAAKEVSGLDLEWCKAPDKGLPAADLVIYLDIPPEVAAQRGEYGKDRYERLEFQTKVASYYQELQDSTWQRVDASQSLDAVQEVLRKASLSVLESFRSGRETLRLWTVQRPY